MDMDLLFTDYNQTFCQNSTSGGVPFSLVDGDDEFNNISNISLYAACNCTNFHKDTQDAVAIAAIRIVFSIFSIVGSASIILSVLLTGKLSAAEVHPLFILSVADFILSILWMIGGVVWINPGPGGWATEKSAPHTGMCYVLAIATTMTQMVAFLLTAVYAQSALLRIREVYLNQGVVLSQNDSRKKLRHIITVVVYITSWILPLLIVLPAVETVVGISSTNNGCWCVLDFFNLRPDNGVYGENSKFNKFAMIHASILGISFIIISLCIGVMYSLTFYYAKKVIRLQSEHSDNNQGGEIIKKIIKRLSLFLIIFLICGLPTLFGSFLVWGEKERLSLSEPFDRLVLYIHAILSPLQGFLNCIVYGWSRQEFRRAVSMKERVQYSNSRRDYESLNHPRPPSSSSYNIGMAKSNALS